MLPPLCIAGGGFSYPLVDAWKEQKPMKRLLVSISIMMICLSLFPTLAQDEGETVTLVTYGSFAISQEVQEQFEQETGYTLEVLRLGDTGMMVNQSILTRNNPLGDVMYGIDNTFLTRGLDSDLFIPYQAEGLDNIPQEFQLDDEFRVTPVTYGDVCLNYDVAYFEDNDLPAPASLADLVDPVYAGMLVVQNPATSSPGLAFLLATIAVFGEDGDYTYLDYWAELVANDVLVTEGWTEAYYGEFTAASEDGQRPLVVSYASSPPAEVYFADPQPESAPTGAVVADDTCFRQIEFVGILNGTEKLEAAQLVVEWVIGIDFQEDLPLQMFVFPVHEQAELPEVFVEFAEIPEQPVEMDYREIDENRERWIEEWTEVVLR
jgi:thiamine transport system substrate-binding protein